MFGMPDPDLSVKVTMSRCVTHDNDITLFITNFYFTRPNDQECKCKCGENVKSHKGAGKTNLKNHIRRWHPKFLKESGSNAVSQFIPSEKARTIYSWLEWVVMENREVSFPDEEYTRN